MLAVHPLELFRVEDCRVLRQAIRREQFDHLRHRHDLDVVSGGPPEQREEIEHRLRQNAHVLIVADGSRAVALAQLLPVEPMNHRQVREPRNRRT